MHEDHNGLLAAYVPRVLLSWPDHVHHQTVQGTLVHIDISGFTAMSERLAAKGKVGAEEVAGVLSTVFTELLTVAGDLGADMLKFGGDALLLLFTGEGHELRSVRASGEMRSRLRRVGKINTPAGRVSLRMTVGIHSGELDFFVVGSTHRELIVTGECATRVVEMEESAEAGEIVMSSATAAAIPGQYLGDVRGEGRLLARMPPPIDHVEPRVEATSDPEDFVPPALRQVATVASGEGEHRVITAAFVKFHGTDAIIRASGGDALCDEINRLVTVAQEAADEFGVAFLATDVDRDGGKIILTAGAPTATGTDAERMLRTVRSIVDRYAGIPLKVGVNRGPAFSGDVGAPFRRSFTVIGDAVNLAARVMTRADDRSILSTPEAVALSEAVFELTPVEPFTVKGKSQPVQAVAVGALVGRRSAEGEDLPLVGREADLERGLSAARGDVPTGLVDIVGPSGIGKSRFVRELRTQSPDTRWHFSAAELFEASTPYFPYQRLLREIMNIETTISAADAAAAAELWVHEHAGDLAPWLPLIATVMDLPTSETEESSSLDPKYRTRRTLETVEAVIDAAVSGPTVLIIEDAHWMDEASLALTRHLAAAGADQPWMLMPVHRPSEDHDIEAPGAVSIELGPLEPDDATRLAETMLEDAPMLTSRLRPIVDRAGGNPLFLEELVTAARSGGDTDELPDSVEGLVLARIDALDPLHRKILRYASVVGASFDIELVKAAMGDLEPAVADPASWRALDEFVVERSKGDMRFRQQIFHDVAYTGLPYRTRRLLHERVGEALEATAGAAVDDFAGRLSVHFLRGGQYDKAWTYSLKAGDDARAKFGNVDAVDFYRRAMRAAEHLEIDARELADLGETLGDAAEFAGMYDEADRAFGYARKCTPDDAQNARLMRKQGLLREKRGEYPQALRWFSRALRGLEDDSPESEGVELRLAYAGVRYQQARYRDTLKWAADALDDAIRRTDPTAAAHAHRLLGLADNRLGNAESVEHLRSALKIYESRNDLVGQADCFNNLGHVDYRMGRWDRAGRRWEQCTETRQRLGDVVGAAIAENNTAAIRSDQGRWDEAEQMFRRVRRVLRAAGSQLGVAAVTSNVGRALARSGRFDEAHEQLDQALSVLSEMGAEQYVLEAKAHTAEAHLFAGEAAQAEAVAVDLMTALRSHAGSGELRALVHRILGYCRLLKGDVDAAAAFFSQSLEIAEEDEARYETALTLEAIDRLPDGRLTGVEQARSRADAIFEELGVIRTPEVPLPALVG